MVSGNLSRRKKRLCARKKSVIDYAAEGVAREPSHSENFVREEFARRGGEAEVGLRVARPVDGQIGCRSFSSAAGGKVKEGEKRTNEAENSSSRRPNLLLALILLERLQRIVKQACKRLPIADVV
jgi:hypothetical protein